MSPPAMPKRTTVFEGELAVAPVPRSAKRQRTTMLTVEIAKPWLTDKDLYGRISYWITVSVATLGIIGSVLRVYFAWVQTPTLGNLCLVMEDNFDTFDTDFTWFHEVDMSGFG